MRQRKVQRLALETPLDGLLDQDPVKILNISIHGALVEVRSRRQVGQNVVFHPTGNTDLALASRVTRCEVVRYDDSGNVTYHVAVNYPRAELEAQARLRQFLIDLLMEAVDKWKKNAATGEDISISLAPLFNVSETEIEASLRDESRLSRVWHRYIAGEWRSENVSSTMQPVDGFCVTSDVARV